MLINNLNIYFYVRKSSVEGKAGMLHVRISVNKKVISVNSVKSIRMAVNDFDHKRQKPNSNTEMGLTCTMFLNEVNKAINSAHIEHEQKGMILTKQAIKKVLTGAQSKVLGEKPFEPTITDVFADYLLAKKELIGFDISLSTYNQYTRYQNIAIKALKAIRIDNYPIVNYTNRDIELFQNQLAKGYAKGTIERSMPVIKNVFEHAISRGWLISNPFNGVKIIREKESDRDLPVWLEQDELKRLINLKLEGPMDQFRDAFVFCCWTGLSVGDYMLMNPAIHKKVISKGRSPKKIVPASIETISDGLILKGRRRKTGTEFRVPLGPEPERIINKYGGLDHLPFNTTKSGVMLSALMNLIGVRKKISFHTARKTFANFLLNDRMMQAYTVTEIMAWKRIEEAKPYVRIKDSSLHRALYGDTKTG